MKYRIFLAVCLLALALAFNAAWAQGPAASGVVVESVDEDIVDEEPAAAKDAPADKEDGGLDLDALLAGDEEDDLLADDKPAVVKTPADSSAAADTGAVAGGGRASGADSVARAGRSDSPADTSVEAGVPAAGRGRQAARTQRPADTVDTGPAVIEDGRTINFAQNLKEYRSPRVAMLLSLLVPGLGQAYSRSYIKAGGFAAAELAVIGVAVYFNSMGKKKKDEAYAFADEYFDTQQLYNYSERLKEEFTKRDTTGTLWDDITKPYELYDDTTFRNAAKNKQTYFYESIRGGYFTPGWSDNDIDLDEILTLTSESEPIVGNSGSRYVPVDESPQLFFYMVMRIADEAGRRINEGPMLGFSNKQAEYNSMMDKANSYHDAVNYTLYALVLNHIASAIDAGFTARAHNARLLGQEGGVWNRLSVEQQYVFTGSEMSQGLALRIRF